MAFDIANRDNYILQLGDREHRCQLSEVAAAVIKDFLDAKERPVRILEYGCGYSSIWYGMALPYAEIHSVEGDEGWYNQMQSLLDQKKLTNVHLHPVPQTSDWRNNEEEVNPRYYEMAEELGGNFDLIVNDGGIREMVGDYVLENADKFINVDGLYLRHDYHNLIKGDWIGYHLQPLPSWVNDTGRACYDNFAATHPNYELITINGNGKWHLIDEFGGLWRKR